MSRATKKFELDNEVKSGAKTLNIGATSHGTLDLCESYPNIFAVSHKPFRHQGSGGGGKRGEGRAMSEDKEAGTFFLCASNLLKLFISESETKTLH